jgi:hypothetical protein
MPVLTLDSPVPHRYGTRLSCVDGHPVGYLSAMANLYTIASALRRAVPSVIVVALAGCTVLPDGALPAGRPPARSSGIVVANGHGGTPSWTSASRTAVTDTNTATTVCRKGGYTSSVRPPEALTEPAKRALLAAYSIPANQISHYELDHLVDLATGGASDIRNLWPEPDTMQQFQPSSHVHNDKDTVESYTFHAVCDGKVTLTAVQNAIATGWTTAVTVLGLPPIPANYRG